MQLAIVIATVLALVLSFGLGVFSLIRNPKSRVVQLWFLTSMAVAVWAFGYINSSLAKTDTEALFYLCIVYIGAGLIPILFFHFVINFLYKAQKYKFLLAAGYFLVLVFLILVSFTNFIIQGVRFTEGLGYYEEAAGLGFKLFLVYFFFFTIYTACLLLKDFKSSDGIRRKQIFYIILAAIVGFIGGTSNFLTALTGIYPYGQFFVWLYPVLVFYGIYTPLEIRLKLK